MAYDKVVDSSVLDDGLQQIADAIREKGGTSASLAFPDAMAEAIAAIETGIDTSDANATATDIASGKTAYVNGEKVTGTIPTVEVAAPAILVGGSTGLIQVYHAQKTGLIASDNNYTDYAETILVEKQLPTQAPMQITPGTSTQTAVEGGKYTTGMVSVKGDANLKAENIAEGVSIFGVLGTFAGGGLPDGIAAVTTGTFTPASDTDGEFIPHGLGVTPTFVYYHAEGDADIADFSGYVVGATISTIPFVENGITVYGNILYSYGKTSYSSVAWYTDYTQYTAEDAVAEYLINDTGFAIGSNVGTPAKAGVTYKWVAVAME